MVTVACPNFHSDIYTIYRNGNHLDHINYERKFLLLK